MCAYLCHGDAWIVSSCTELRLQRDQDALSQGHKEKLTLFLSFIFIFHFTQTYMSTSVQPILKERP